jgi:hypothetical protein
MYEIHKVLRRRLLIIAGGEHVEDGQQVLYGTRL